MLDSGHFRFIAWVSASSLVATQTAPNFFILLSQDLNNNFGTILPAIPFAALLTILFALRWKDLHEILLRKKMTDLGNEIPFRLVGVSALVLLILVRGINELWVESESIALIATFYAMALILNPQTRKIMLPYAIIYSLGIAAPSLLQWSLGEPLVSMSVIFSAKLISLSGLSVAWEGSNFTFFSRAGEVISGTVTPGCSSVISITTFLGLLALMYLDMRKAIPPTIRLAIMGIVVLIALNILRITGLIWIGYLGGADALWSIHNWLGYAIFVGFYLVVLLAYSKAKQNPVISSNSGNRRTLV